MPATPDSPHALALRYGVDLPTAPTLRPEPPGFAVGSAYRMTFSPDGRHLVVPTANGTFLWDVGAREKRLKLAVPSNPHHFTFTADGRELLVLNGKGEYARVAIPSGEVVSRFKAKFRYRLDGIGCLGPGNEHVLQLAYGGRFLMLDSSSGKVLLERRLEPTGCDGGVHWIPERGEVVIVQASVQGANGRQTPSALWRWKWPLGAHEPERDAGTWDGPSSRLLPGAGLLLLHHRLDRKAESGSVIDVLDVRTWQVRRRIACGGDTWSSPALAHDGSAWSWATFGSVVVETDAGRIALDTMAGGADFSPVADLVAISGRLGFVAPVAQLPALRALVRVQRDVEELSLRGGSRMTTLPGRRLPPRIVVYAGPSGVLFEAEAIAGLDYVPRAATRLVAPEAGRAPLLEALAATVAEACDDGAATGAGERRRMNGGTVTPPPGQWQHAVSVSLASDAIDIWAMKRSRDGTFQQLTWPLAAIPAGSHGAALWDAIERMLGRQAR